jgi:phage baseplate assembly protein W
MPIPQTIRVNPLDLQKNIAIGITLPCRGSRVFHSTYTTKDQIKANLANLLLTNPGERLMNPVFGTNLRGFLFEGVTNENIERMKNSILNSISLYLPEITITSLIIQPNTDYNLIDIFLDYIINISQTPDQVTVQFQ